MHLDARTHAELLSGTLGPDAARALARHLEAGCEACEAFLAGCERADGIDGRVDGALAAVAWAPDAERPRAAAEAFGRIERRLAAERALRPGVGGRQGRLRRWVPLAAAASVLAAGLAALALRAPEPSSSAWDGTKGPEPAASAAVPVQLRFLVVAAGGAGDAELRRGASGDAVPASAALQFEVEVGRAAFVTLVRVPPGGPPEPVWDGAVGPGAVLVTLDGRPAIYRLEGLGGTHRFVALASEAPPPPGALERELAARRAAAGERRPDEVEVRIE